MTPSRNPVFSRGRRGFTLIEILIAIAIFAFLLVLMGVGYLASAKAWEQGRVKLTMQQEATFGLEQVARDIRASRSVSRISATELRCFDEDSTETARYTFASIGGKNYVLRSGTKLVDKECTFLNFNYNAGDGVVEFQIELKDPGSNKVRVDSKANLRNRNTSAI